MIEILGSPVSPYVRKVLAILMLKEIPFAIDPGAPFYGNDRFSTLSPLRRVPALIDGATVIADSSVIAHYLEEKYPQAPILPASPEERARIRYLDDYANGRIGDVFIRRCFWAIAAAPSIWGAPRDVPAFEKAVREDVPQIMDYLESVAPADGFFVGDFGLADISVAVMFRNMRYIRWTPDAERWSKTAAWIERAEEHPSLAAPTRWSDELARTAIPEQRERARALGLTLTADSCFTEKPRPGPMSVSAPFAVPA